MLFVHWTQQDDRGPPPEKMGINGRLPHLVASNGQKTYTTLLNQPMELAEPNNKRLMSADFHKERHPEGFKNTAE